MITNVSERLSLRFHNACRSRTPTKEMTRDDLQPGLVNYIILEGVSGRDASTWKDVG